MFVPGYSGGPAAALHGIPLTESGLIIAAVLIFLDDNSPLTQTRFAAPHQNAQAGARMIELVIGGARSGKSAYAEKQALEAGLHVIYIATATAQDIEMERRIAHHRAGRPLAWGSVEAPLRIAETLHAHAAPATCLLVDCLTLWLSNLFFAGAAARQAEAGEAIDCPLLSGATQALFEALPALPGRVILVSNEIGWGGVSTHPVARLFADEQGRLNQRVAALSDQVTLVAAGLPLSLKSSTRNY
jgi:adenosylcobinamide kinase/adenosylcobinamide-phosphate guanylyltransferase